MQIHNTLWERYIYSARTQVKGHEYLSYSHSGDFSYLCIFCSAHTKGQTNPLDIVVGTLYIQCGDLGQGSWM